MALKRNHEDMESSIKTFQFESKFKNDVDLTEEFEVLKARSKTSDPSSGTGRHLAATFGPNDGKPGFMSDMSKISSGDAYNPLLLYFGPPSTVSPYTTGWSPDKTAITLRDNYEKQNLFLSSTVDRLVRTLDSWPTKWIMPWMHTDQLHITWNQLDVDNTLPDINPELAPARLLKARSTTRESHLNRYSLAFIMEHGFWSTPEGKNHYILMVSAIAQAVLNLVMVMVLREIFRVASVYELHLRTDLKINPQVGDSIRISRDLFAASQKDKNFLEKMITYSDRYMKTQNVVPTDFIIPADLRMFAFSNTSNKLDGLYKNENINNLMSGDSFKYLGRRIHAIVGLFIDNNPEEINPAKRVAQVGDYAKMTTYHRSGASFRTSDRDIYIMNMDSNLGNFHRITWDDAIAHCGRFDNKIDKKGPLSTKHDDLAKIPKNAIFPGLDGKHWDMFLVESDFPEDAHGYHLRKTEMWGEMYHHFLTDKAIRDSSETIAAGLLNIPGRSPQQAASHLRDGLAFIEELSHCDLASEDVQAWFTAVIAGTGIITDGHGNNAIRPGSEVVPDLPVLRKVDGDKYEVYYRKGLVGSPKPIYKISAVQLLLRDNKEQLQIDYMGRCINDQLFGDEDKFVKYLADTDPYFFSTGEEEDVARKIMDLVGLNLSSATTESKTAWYGDAYGVKQSVINAYRQYEEQTATITNPNAIKPYGYGSWRGMKAIANLEKSGGDYNGIPEKCVSIASNYVYVVERMYAVAVKLMGSDHLVLKGTKVPWYFSSGIAEDDKVAGFAQSFVDRTHRLPALTFYNPRPYATSRGPASEESPLAGVAEYVAKIGIITLTKYAPDDAKNQGKSSKLVLWNNSQEGYDPKDDDIVSKTILLSSNPGDPPRRVNALLTDNDVRHGIYAWKSYLTKAIKYSPAFVNFVERNGHNGYVADSIPANHEWEQKLTAFIEKCKYSHNVGTLLQRRGNSFGDFLNDVIVMNFRDKDGHRKTGYVLDFLTSGCSSGQLSTFTDQTISTAIKLAETRPTPTLPGGGMQPVFTTGGTDQNDPESLGTIMVVSRLIISKESFHKFQVDYDSITDKRDQTAVHANLILAPVDPVGLNAGIGGTDTDAKIKAFAYARARQDAMKPHARAGLTTVGHRRGTRGAVGAGPSGTSARRGDPSVYASTGVRALPQNTSSASGVNRRTRQGAAYPAPAPLDPAARDEALKRITKAREDPSMFQDVPSMFEGVDAPFVVCYGGDDDRALNTNLIENYVTCLRESDDALRVAMTLLIFAGIDHACFTRWSENNILVPVDVLLMRPHHRYLMLSAVACRGGNEFGNVVYGNEMFETGDEAKTMTHTGHHSLYANALVKNVLMMMIWHNIKACEYLSGEGVGFWSANWDPKVISSPRSQGNGVKPSIFSVICPYGSLVREPRLENGVYTPGLEPCHHSVLGYWRPGSFTGLAVVPKPSLPHYPSAVYTDHVYHFSNLNTTVSDARGKSAFNCNFNEIVSQTLQLVTDPMTGEQRKKFILGFTPFGPNLTGDAMKGPRLGEVFAKNFEEQGYTTDRGNMVY